MNKKILLFECNIFQKNQIIGLSNRCGIEVAAFDKREEYQASLGVLAGLSKNHAGNITGKNTTGKNTTGKNTSGKNITRKNSTGKNITGENIAGKGRTLQPAVQPLAGPMLVFCGMQQQDVFDLIDAWNKAGIPAIDHKAMLTPFNAAWMPDQLYRELDQEHKKMH